MQTTHQQGLASTLDAHHQQQASTSVNHQQALMSTVTSNQGQVLAHYNGLKRLSMRNYQQSTVVANKVDTASQTSSAHHFRTRDMVGTLTAEVQRLQVSLSSGSVRQRQSGRDISFPGEHSDMIMAHLLPLQSDLERALDDMIAQYGQDVSAHDVQWLQSEFWHLVDSAAQERASYHPESTAQAFDQWSYPEDTVGFLKLSAKKQTECSSVWPPLARSQAEATQSSWMSRERRKRPNQTFSMEIPAGVLRISMPHLGRTKYASRDTQTIEELDSLAPSHRVVCPT
jgi:hypothetical protein